MQDRRAQAQTIAGLLLLRHALADDACWWRLGRSATGRPEIAGGPSFSISHSKDRVACAIADVGPIGLDIEARRDDVSPRLIARIATAEHEFFAAWCAREATVKASGRVGLARVRAIELGSAHARLDNADWPLRWLDLAPGYAACLAVAPDAAASLEDVSCEEIDGRALVAEENRARMSANKRE
ncbi:4'-phosphopantetheinyl transferase family protein [Salinisphaera japonica]|nr:hypothetical protein [Salinisphaera japonica]